MIVILSAVAGGVCGLLDGRERRLVSLPNFGYTPRPPQRIVLPPGVYPDTYDGLAEDERQLAADAERVMNRWWGVGTTPDIPKSAVKPPPPQNPKRKRRNA